MREYTPENITDTVIEQMSTTPDPRMKEIMESAVRHLHAFAREVKLTPAEWIRGIEFMTKVGQMCSPARQEFILLSDTMGLSALVNVMHDKTKMEEATGASLLGPFFRENTPPFEHGASIARIDKGGQEIVLYGRITDAQGRPLPNAMLTVWQTAADGRYDIQNSLEEIDCRGIFFTDKDGNYLVRTVRPLGYYIPLDGPVGQMVLAQKRHGKRPAHIHFLVAAPGYRELVTALYLAGDEHLDDDVVFGASGDLVVDVKSSDRACPIAGLPSVHFDFSLARESEADRKAGRVGADPAQVTKSGNGAPAGPYGAPPPEVLAAEQKKGGFLGGLFRK
ncbi:MAG TPA: dioxygenase [Hyphomicrobiaceae bacterium]|jgi:catechol 1,2-dioxygenase/hydroxyquinol 1,2-dioxygenase